MKAILPGATRMVASCAAEIASKHQQSVGAERAPLAQLEGTSAITQVGQPVQNSVPPNPKCFRIKVKDAPVAQLDRASAF